MPVAASRSANVAFVVNVSGAAVSLAEQVAVEIANTAWSAGLDEDDVARVVELNAAAGRYAITGKWETYAELRDRALRTWARPVAAGFPDSREHPNWTFFRGVGFFDPMPYWSLVKQPVLVVYGEEDESHNVPVEESVRRLEFVFEISHKTNGEVLIIPEAGHGLVKDGRLMREFVGAFDGWLGEVVGG